MNSLNRRTSRARALAKKGFTLIELRVGITNRAILGAAAFAIIGDASDSAKAVAFIDNSASVKNSAQLFETQTGCFPANGTVLFDKAEAATRPLPPRCRWQTLAHRIDRLTSQMDLLVPNPV